MKPRPTKKLTIIFTGILAFSTLTGCNPFIDDDSGIGKECVTDLSCPASLVCCLLTCQPECPDADGDGFDSQAAGGPDCDDNDPGINPAADEICDGKDNDCDNQEDEGQTPQDCARSNEHGICAGFRYCEGQQGWSECDAREPAAENCDGIDNNCDGQADEGLDFRDCPLSQGVCQGARQRCDNESWTACDYGDDYEENVETICDDLDNDCDGQTDEALDSRPCPLDTGVCAGSQAVRTCQAPGIWTLCDYHPDYEPDQETLCDGLDNDCDGQTDEELMQLVPESGPWASDGIDNNCNGLIDEPGGVMVPAHLWPGVWIDAYETSLFENPDCTGTAYGRVLDNFPVEFPASGEATISLYACSLPNVLPTGFLSYYRAKRACQAQNKRLCSAQEYRTSCNAGGNDIYPYANIFVPGICNDGWAGSGVKETTGLRPECSADGTTFDMSGNLAEWVEEDIDNAPGYALVGGYGYACILCSYGVNCLPCDPDEFTDADAIEALSQCPLWDAFFGQHLHQRAHPKGQFRPYLGARCCYDGP